MKIENQLNCPSIQKIFYLGILNLYQELLVLWSQTYILPLHQLMKLKSMNHLKDQKRIVSVVLLSTFFISFFKKSILLKAVFFCFSPKNELIFSMRESKTNLGKKGD